MTTALLVLGLLTFAGTDVNGQSGRAMSPVQLRLLAQRGQPSHFIVQFITEQVDPASRRLVRLARPRTLETWIYLRAGTSYAFDDGTLVETLAFADGPQYAAALPATTLRPADFSPSMTTGDLLGRFGRADKAEFVRIGTRDVNVYRFLKPGRNVASFAFVNNRLGGVEAGFAIVYPPPPDANYLGTHWNENESGWTGTWIRRGTSNLFDASWTYGGASSVRAVLTMMHSDDTLTIERRDTSDDITCRYSGMVQPDRVTVFGRYYCNRVTSPEGFTWRATIQGGR